jgi:hypothetical protein
MVYNIQNHFVYRPEFQITRKHNVSETGFIFVFRSVQGDTYTVGSLRKSKTQLMSSGEVKLIPTLLGPLERAKHN